MEHLSLLAKGETHEKSVRLYRSVEINKKKKPHRREQSYGWKVFPMEMMLLKTEQQKRLNFGPIQAGNSKFVGGNCVPQSSFAILLRTFLPFFYALHFLSLADTIFAHILRFSLKNGLQLTS